MSYRNITVGGKQYKYVIGRADTKIVGIGTFWNEQVGNQRSNDTYEVTPGIVADLIAKYQKLEKMGAVEKNDPRLSQ